MNSERPSASAAHDWCCPQPNAAETTTSCRRSTEPFRRSKSGRRHTGYDRNTGAYLVADHQRPPRPHRDPTAHPFQQGPKPSPRSPNPRRQREDAAIEADMARGVRPRLMQKKDTSQWAKTFRIAVLATYSRLRGLIVNLTLFIQIYDFWPPIMILDPRLPFRSESRQ